MYKERTAGAFRKATKRGGEMQRSEYSIASDDEFVEFEHAGAPVKGGFECSSCGYGVTITQQLPRCPMCGGELWERSPWSPFRTAPTGLRSRLD